MRATNYSPFAIRYSPVTIIGCLSTTRPSNPGCFPTFSAPAYPGETIRTEIWRDGERVSFRARTLERDTLILNNGLAKISDQ
jgi:hypothetical protein